jgi:Domain of unknown function (DUF2017)
VTSFKPTRRGVVVSFDEVEAELLRLLVGEVYDLLVAEEAPPAPPADPDAAMLAQLTGLGGPTPRPPDDPVLRRLLPDGYRDDEAASGEFRRYTEATLRDGKRATAAALLADLPPDGGGEVRLEDESLDRWLTGLNDVRLTLGTKLGVTEDMDEPDPDDPAANALSVYHWLTEVQSVLIEVVAATEE